MGCEYNINFKMDDTQEVSELLKALPYFLEVKSFQNRNQYIFRTSGNSGALPSGLAEIDANGIYFCDYGEGRDILRELIFRVGLSYKKLEVIDHSE